MKIREINSKLCEKAKNQKFAKIYTRENVQIYSIGNASDCDQEVNNISHLMLFIVVFFKALSLRRVKILPMV